MTDPATKKSRVKYPTVIKVCSICSFPFAAKQGSPKEKKTCSYSCANKKFRSGKNNANYKSIEELETVGSYRELCFRKHKKECVVCGESKIVSVHHYDENHSNNDIRNLVPLCPTHHQYVHSRYAEEVKPVVDLYVNRFCLEYLLDNLPDE